MQNHKSIYKYIITMRVIKLIVILGFVLPFFSAAQKAVITARSYTGWTRISNSKLNADGKYVIYNLINTPSGQNLRVIKATNGSWERQFSAMGQNEFSADGKRLYSIINGVIICFELGTDKQWKIATARSFKLYQDGPGERLIYNDDSLKCLVIREEKKSTELQFKNVKSYTLYAPQHKLLMSLKGDDDSREILHLLDLKSGKDKDIYKGYVASSIIIDGSGNNIAFTTNDSSGDKKIWHYESGFDSARLIFLDNKVRAGQMFSVDEVWRFSEDGSKIYFTFPTIEPAYTKNEDEPDIWSYQDRIIYPQYKQSGFGRITAWRNFSSLNLYDGKLTQFLFGNEHIAPGQIRGKDKFVMETGDSIKSYYLIDALNNERIRLNQAKDDKFSDIQFSPDNKFLTYRNEKDGRYRCFEFSTKKTYDFTISVKAELELYNAQTRSDIANYLGIAGWIKGTSHVLMIGKVGIWELDVKGDDQPKKLTLNKADSSKIFFSFCGKYETKVIDPAEDLFVYGLNFDTKATSLFKLNIKKKQFVKLYEGNFFWSKQYSEVNSNLFQKATGENGFLLKFPTVEQSPNLLFTKDFKSFDTLTHNFPEQHYNWIKSELHTYKDSLGNTCQGILYKPENFDPNKKYPVVFYFYQDISHLLHEPIEPEPARGGIAIAHLVSNGYLVFRPDIYIAPNKFGDMLMMSITAAADHLAVYKWVDKSKMAIAGHSFGGYEVNYILTRSTRFAAALSGASLSSIVNHLFDLGVMKEEIRPFVMLNSRMNVDFEDNPELYIYNSPIYRSKYVTTPVLFLHSEDDEIVPFYHSAQFFMSLRHQGKMAWLLSYKNGGHGVLEKDRPDYTNRVKEFFDYFLKDTPKPGWLDKHIGY